MRRTYRGLAAALSLTLILLAADAPTKSSSGRREDQAALKPYGGLVGGWKNGVGQVERGKTRGSWTETASCAWKLSSDSAALELTITKGKYLKSALIKPGPKPDTYVMDAILPDGAKRAFTGGPDAKKALKLTATEPGGAGVKRITLTLLHESRLIMLLEGQDADRDFTRLGEVGFTREGVSFAVGESGPICIVTEGRGTIPISYKGKTYYVCCSGCKDLFNENPEAVLAEAAEREKAKNKK